MSIAVCSETSLDGSASEMRCKTCCVIDDEQPLGGWRNVRAASLLKDAHAMVSSTKTPSKFPAPQLGKHQLTYSNIAIEDKTSSCIGQQQNTHTYSTET